MTKKRAKKPSASQVREELRRIYLERFIGEVEGVSLKLETIENTDLACAVGMVSLSSAVWRFREDWDSAGRTRRT